MTDLTLAKHNIYSNVVKNAIKHKLFHKLLYRNLLFHCLNIYKYKTNYDAFLSTLLITYKKKFNNTNKLIIKKYLKIDNKEKL